MRSYGSKKCGGGRLWYAEVRSDGVSTAERITQPLVDGENLTRDEFLCRWEELPEVKSAELLEGVVYVPSPVSVAHSSHDGPAVMWLVYYAGFTSGCEAGPNATWLMLEDAPQPDVYLRILPEWGGQTSSQCDLASGAPELIVETAVSSAARDLGPKLRLYRSAGVQEYITVLVKEQRLIWRRLAGGDWVTLEPDPDGVQRSIVFPGLWLDPAALLRKDVPGLLDVVQRGLQSEEHQQFVEGLAKRLAAR